jgi:hypothetical protein
MGGKIDQCVCIKFCVTFSKSATKTFKMLCEAFGEHSLSWIAVSERHSHFKASRVSVEDDTRSGCPSTSKITENVETISELINEHHHHSIHELADAFESVMEFARRS